MDYKKYKQLSKDDKEEFMFYQLKDKIYIPQNLNFGIILYFLISIKFILIIFMIIFLAHYDMLKFGYLLQSLSIISYGLVLSVFILLAVFLMELFVLIYKGYKQYKIFKRYKK